MSNKENKEKTVDSPEIQKILEEVSNLKGSFKFSLYVDDTRVTHGNTTSCDGINCPVSNVTACNM